MRSVQVFKLDGKKVTLGDMARDTITGFEGKVIAGVYWLNGCIRIGIQPTELKDGKPIDAEYFDIQQVEVIRPKKESKASKPTGGPAPNPKYYDKPKGF